MIWLYRIVLGLLIMVDSFLAFLFVEGMIDAYRHPEDYHFGGDAMGGWPYDSLFTYELNLVLYLAIAVLSGLSAYRSRSRRFRLFALSLLPALMIFMHVHCFHLGGCP